MPADKLFLDYDKDKKTKELRCERKNGQAATLREKKKAQMELKRKAQMELKEEGESGSEWSDEYFLFSSDK